MKILAQTLTFAACFLLAAEVTFIGALKFAFPMEPVVRQEAMWLMAKGHSHDSDKQREALELIIDERHGFGRYEREALLAQIEVLEKGKLGDERAQSFCKALMWNRCEKSQVQAALSILFRKGE